jgi:acyl carrier protein
MPLTSSNPSRRAKFTKEELFAHVRCEAAKILKVSPGELRPEARWVDDLEADSLDLTELAATVEARFGIRVEDADLVPLPTVRDSCELIWRLISEHEEGRSEALKTSGAMAGSTTAGPSPAR